jgi:hypothetical protein
MERGEFGFNLYKTHGSKRKKQKACNAKFAMNFLLQFFLNFSVFNFSVKF